MRQEITRRKSKAAPTSQRSWMKARTGFPFRPFELSSNVAIMTTGKPVENQYTSIRGTLDQSGAKTSPQISQDYCERLKAPGSCKVQRSA